MRANSPTEGRRSLSGWISVLAATWLSAGSLVAATPRRVKKPVNAWRPEKKKGARMARNPVGGLGSRHIATLLAFGIVCSGLTTITLVNAPEAANAAPGNPGVPGNPFVLYEEDFENSGDGTNTLLTQYVSASGATYTAAPFWASRDLCNGIIVDATSPRVAGDCNGGGGDARGASIFPGLSRLARALGVIDGAADPDRNGAASSYTSGNGADNQVQFQSSNITSTTAGRFITFSVDAVAENCFVAHPLLRFYLSDAGVVTPVSTSAIDPCTDPRSTEVAPGLWGGSFPANASRLMTSNQVAVILRNEEGDGTGNDGAYDNIRVLDVTPQLDKAFSPTSVPVGGVSTLTLTVTNTSDLAAKSGWAFTDTLPAGLVIASPANTGGTCDAMVGAAAGGSAIAVTNGNLAAGEVSCTITVDVTSDTPAPSEPSPKVYQNCAENISNVIGMNLPNCATVEFYTERDLEITKTSDATADARPGDVVTYTVTATNIGTGDYTDAFPALVRDDLTGVLDDATYNGDAVASVGAAPSLASPVLSWSGALPVGDSVSITFTVTLAPGGDGAVRNVAFGCDPAVEVCDVTPACDPPTAEGVDPVTGLPCAEVEFFLPRLAHSKVADTTELPADGGVVTYTITATNQGPGVFTLTEPGSFSDDLSNVLDDGSFNNDAVASSGAVVFNPVTQRLDWSGALGVGVSATITYSVTYDSDSPSGDNVLLNVACVPVEVAADPANLCRSVQVPGSELQDRKSSDPVSGSSVVSGQQVTYTLYFENTGETTASVDTFDEMVATLDDATLTAGPTVSNPALVATVSGTRILITGQVPVDTTYTVSYTVTVNPFEAQGDHILGNVLGECLEADPTCRTEHPVRHVSVTKVSDPTTGVNTGDTVTYTVTVLNDGEADYTAEVPAMAEDDLTGVIDDAVYNDDAVASAGSVSYTAPLLSWSGALAVGASASFTYSVTVSNEGDHVLENAARAVCAAPEICEPVIVIHRLPHVVPSKSSDPVSGSSVVSGQQVTYTLSWVNDGAATGQLDETDDLSEVLDDATVTAEPVTSDAAVAAVRSADEIAVTGPIEPGQTITVTYQVTIRPDGDRGNNILRNVLTPGVPPCLVPADCPPPTTEHFVGELDDWKTVDPASGGTVRAGQEVTYTLHFENIGEAPVAVDRDDVLTQVLDDATVTAGPVASDAVLSVSAITGGRFTVTGELAAGQLVTVSYTVVVNPDGQRGDDRLGNFLVGRGVEPPVECVPEDQQRPDCTVNHVSDVVPAKSSDPASGTRLSPGQRVTYTLTFENVSTNPDAAAAVVDYTDHLVDVLDDAVVTTGPVASDAAAVTAVVVGDTIRVTGALSAGESVSVSYTVTVNPYDRQGNHHLGNVVAVTGESPVCAAGSGLCTSHPLLPPPTLAVTGATLAWGIPAAALLLLIAGGIILITRRRGTLTTVTEEGTTGGN